MGDEPKTFAARTEKNWHRPLVNFRWQCILDLLVEPRANLPGETLRASKLLNQVWPRHLSRMCLNGRRHWDRFCKLGREMRNEDGERRDRNEADGWQAD
jgi:hypothetical protein